MLRRRPGRATKHTFEAQAAAGNFPFAISGMILNADSPLPIYEQLCAAFRNAITSGDLPAGPLLPTSRELAEAMALGRNTVVSAYSRLAAEGYLVANTRRGT